MKKYLAFLFAFLNCLSIQTLSAQVTTALVNQKVFGGSNIDMLTGSKKTNDGGFIIYGYSKSGISGEKTDSSRGGNDIWIVKLNPNLSIQWQKTIGGSANDVINDITFGKDGGYLCLAASNSPISGDKTISSFGNNDYWVIKLDIAGNIKWQNVYGGSDSDIPTSIIQLNSGKIIISGNSSSGISGNKTEVCRGLNDYWIVCSDSLGNKLWDKTIGASQGDSRPQMGKTSDNNLVLCGASNSPISNEKTSPCFGSNDLWVVKIDTTGSILWDKTFGGTDNEGMVIALIIKNDNIFICSESASGVSGNKTDSCKGSTDYWVLKLDKNGNKAWDKSIGGSMGDLASSIIYTQSNELVIGGTSGSSISGDKTENSLGNYDYWIVGLDTNGVLKWQKTIGGSDDDGINGLIEIVNNHYLVSGYSKSGLSGNKTEASRGNYDYWVVELSTNSSISENNINNLQVFPNPFTNSIFISMVTSFNKGNLTIYNLIGEIVYQTVIKDKKSEIKLQLSKGIYLVKLVTDNNEVYTSKILKN
jgi:hypothetical protein